MSVEDLGLEVINVDYFLKSTMLYVEEDVLGMSSSELFLKERIG
ncbi:hypothetical protein [Methanolapillus africanus]